MKKLLTIFIFLVSFAFSTSVVNAAENHLHTITLEKKDTGYNIILGSDKLAKVSKKTPSNNELLIDLNGIDSSETINALYKGTNNINGLIIENTAPNKLRIHITAENIKNSTVMIEPKDGEATIVAETVPMDMVLWIVFVMALLSVIYKMSKTVAEEDDKILIKKDIKDREIQMYKKYRNELYSNPINQQRKNIRMNNMLKKIDRKIDERLTTIIK